MSQENRLREVDTEVYIPIAMIKNSSVLKQLLHTVMMVIGNHYFHE